MVWPLAPALYADRGNVARSDGANGTYAPLAVVLSSQAGLMRFTARQHASSVHIDKVVAMLVREVNARA